jgi:hypothetical protein
VTLFTSGKGDRGAMHNVVLAVTFIGVVALVFASLIALERLIG